MLVPGETLLFSPRGMVTATALKWSGYGRQLGGGNYCARDCRWSWRGLRTGRDGKRQQADQQYSVYRQSHNGFPRRLVGSTIRAPFLKRQALSLTRQFENNRPLQGPPDHHACASRFARPVAFIARRATDVSSCCSARVDAVADGELVALGNLSIVGASQLRN